MTATPDHDAHQKQARDRSIRCAVLTISDTRTPQTDTGGPLIADLLGEAGHKTIAQAIVPDEKNRIEGQIEAWLADESIEAIMTTGGTGISRRDITIDVVCSLIDTPLPGFGELFRMISYQEIKAAAMLSRAEAGLVIRPAEQGGETFIFALPGSPHAITTAMKHLICPQIAHLVWERTKA